MNKGVPIERHDRLETDGSIVLRPIGVVRSPLKDPSGDAPYQSFVSDIEGEIEVFEEYERGLDGIERFSHICVVYYLHLSERTKIRTIPLFEEEERGVFGTRSPSRPNHIGISTVRLLEHRSRSLRVRGLDMLDGTPVLDVKPYVLHVDIVRGADDDWLTRKLAALSESGDKGIEF